MAVLRESEERPRFLCTDNDAILVLTVKAIFNSSLIRTESSRTLGEVPFSRRTYTVIIDKGAHRFSYKNEYKLSFQNATTTYVGSISSQTKVIKEKYFSKIFSIKTKIFILQLLTLP